MKSVILSLAAALALYGCSADERSHRTSRVGDPSGAHDDTRGPVSNAIDPVTGATVRADSAWNTHWQGNWYYFNSEESLRKFRSNPTAYVTEDGRLKNPNGESRPAEVR